MQKCWVLEGLRKFRSMEVLWNGYNLSLWSYKRDQEEWKIKGVFVRLKFSSPNRVYRLKNVNFKSGSFYLFWLHEELLEILYINFVDDYISAVKNLNLWSLFYIVIRAMYFSHDVIRELFWELNLHFLRIAVYHWYCYVRYTPRFSRSKGWPSWVYKSWA